MTCLIPDLMVQRMQYRSLRCRHRISRSQHSMLTAHHAIWLEQYSMFTPQHRPFTPQDACGAEQHASCTAHALIGAQHHRIAPRAKMIRPLSQRHARAEVLMQFPSPHMRNATDVNCAAAGTSFYDQNKGQCSARSSRSSSNPDSGHSGRTVCSTPTCHMIGSPHYSDSCCFSCLVILPCAWFLLLNSNLQNMLFGISILCGRTVALKQS